MNTAKTKMMQPKDQSKALRKTRVTGSACVKHDFREFWKTNYYGRLKLKETKCIYCYEKI